MSSFFVFVAVHWLIMTVWIVSQQTDFCESKVQELFFDCIVGVIYCFNFFNLKEGKTRWRACIFYLIIFFENAALLSIWFLANEMDLYLKIAILIAIFTAFVLGKLASFKKWWRVNCTRFYFVFSALCLLGFYYCLCHPSQPFKRRKKTQTPRKVYSFIPRTRPGEQLPVSTVLKSLRWIQEFSWLS